MATKEKQQDILTKDSLNHPVLKPVKDMIDMEFEAVEGGQEAGKWGKKSGRQDDRP